MIGHSHATAVVEAARAIGMPVDFCNLWFDTKAVLAGNTGPRLHADIAARIAKADTVVSTLGGGAYLVLGLFAGTRPFDVLTRGSRREDMEPGTEAVPVAAVRAAIGASEAGALALLKEVASHTRGRLLHMIPPPCTHEWEGEGFRRIADRMALLQNSAAPALPAVTPRFLRLWRLMAEVHRSAAAGVAAEAVAPPATALDAVGWLRADHAVDFAHGNARYGIAALSWRGIPAGGDGAMVAIQ